MSRLIRLKGLPRLTANTIVTKAELMAELTRVRKQGYAIDDQENELDGRCIGAPIQAPDGRVLAAVSISSPVFRMDMNRAKSLAPALKSACAEIARSRPPRITDMMYSRPISTPRQDRARHRRAPRHRHGYGHRARRSGRRYRRNQRVAGREGERGRASGGSARAAISGAMPAIWATAPRCDAFIETVKRECPPIDILVNNAGAILRKPAAEFPDEYWDKTIEIDLNAQWVLAREFGRDMLARGSGKMIFTASLLSFQGGITVPATRRRKAAWRNWPRRCRTNGRAAMCR